VTELRWTLFVQKSKDGAQLPSTLGTLVPHTWRAYHMALVWKASQKTCPKLPSPTCYYYWQSEDDRLKPVYCVKDPAPEALLAHRKCNCKLHQKVLWQFKNQLLYLVQICGVGVEMNTKTVLMIGQRLQMRHSRINIKMINQFTHYPKWTVLEIRTFKFSLHISDLRNDFHITYIRNGLHLAKAY